MENSKRLQMEYWPVERLIKYKNNAKTHPETQVDKIANSIRDYGFDQPIAVDTDGMIIKGHGRLLAAMQLGMKEVPVIVRDDLSLMQAAASRIADNKVAESAWDAHLLPLELNMLDQEGFDLQVIGFSPDEINDLMGNLKFSSDDDAGGKGHNSNLSADGNEHVKMIQLFYTPENEETFRSVCDVLQSRYGTANLSDTVFRALEFAGNNHGQENNS